MIVAILLAIYVPKGAFLLMYGSAVAGMYFVWIVILLAHLRFRRSIGDEGKRFAVAAPAVSGLQHHGYFISRCRRVQHLLRGGPALFSSDFCGAPGRNEPCVLEGSASLERIQSREVHGIGG